MDIFCLTSLQMKYLTVFKDSNVVLCIYCTMQCECKIMSFSRVGLKTMKYKIELERQWPTSAPEEGFGLWCLFFGLFGK